MIFVFGSNLSGIHGAGAALYAHKNLGAQWGVGEGITGNSYALPTKGINISYMPIDKVAIHVAKFIEYASTHLDDVFQVTCVGCGLAGFKDSEIAPIFDRASKNCLFDLKWKPFLGPHRTYWGTF